MAMATNKQAGLWMMLGLVGGLSLAYLWPHEPVQASASDRSTQFAICTGPAGGVAGLTDQLDGVFTLDFLTSDLRGAVLNRQTGKFTCFYRRNLAQDFAINPKSEPKYAIVTGQGQLSGRGGVTPASGVLYVAELTSGRVMCYAFQWKDSRVPVTSDFTAIDGFSFRQAAEKE